MTNAMPASAVVLLSDCDGVRTITLNRPAAFNAFDAATKSVFLAALTAAATDPAVRAVVITGSGRAFCAGQDLKEHQRLVAAGDPRVATTVTEFYNIAVSQIVTMAKPVLAAVNGAAAGAGVALACACDLRMAAAGASFSMAFAQAGLSADSGASFTVPRLIGAGRASMLMLTGEKIDAVQAERIGLVDTVVADADLAAAAQALAARLAAGPTRAYAAIKASLHHGHGADLASSLVFEAQAQADLFTSADHREAIAAFVAKRPPRFYGR